MTSSLSLSCVVCGGPGRGLFRAHGHEILGCEGCGHRFAAIAPSEGHVARTYGDDYFSGGGAGYDDYPSEAERLRERGAAYVRLVRAHLSPGTVLDVGAAAGFLLEARSLLEHKLAGGPLPWLAAPLGRLPASLGIPYPGDDLFWALFQDERDPLGTSKRP